MLDIQRCKLQLSPGACKFQHRCSDWQRSPQPTATGETAHASPMDVTTPIKTLLLSKLLEGYADRIYIVKGFDLGYEGEQRQRLCGNSISRK